MVFMPTTDETLDEILNLAAAHFKVPREKLSPDGDFFRALGDQIVAAADLLQRLPAPIVFDHMARVGQPAGVESPAFALVRKLIDKGRTWVKLSGAYMDTRMGPPAYADTSAVAKAYLKAAPERMVWGSDWPHPTEKADAKPDDAILFNLLADWAPNEATRTRILVDNPVSLYGFG